MKRRNYLLQLVIFAAGFALAQLTRNTDYEHAIGFACRAFWEAIGAGLTLFAMGLGALMIYQFLMDGADRLSLDAVLKRMQREAR